MSNTCGTSWAMHLGAVIAVSDLERARAFYEGRLGLRGEPTPGGWLLTAGSGTVCYLLPDTPEAGTATWPVASFRVEDVHATVGLLRSRGVPFLGSDDLPFRLDEDGVSADTEGIEVAWMRDPDGSILTIFATRETTSGHGMRTPSLSGGNSPGGIGA